MAMLCSATDWALAPGVLLTEMAVSPYIDDDFGVFDPLGEFFLGLGFGGANLNFAKGPQFLFSLRP
jgi:hypothetical protein